MEFDLKAGFTSRQMEAVKSLDSGLTKFLLYGGALGGGKSYFLRWWCFRRLFELYRKWRIKNAVGMLACEDYPSLKDRQLVKISHEIPTAWGKLHDDHKIYGRCFVLKQKHGGGVLCFRNLDDPSKYQCFHPDTDILTVTGWKAVSDVTVSETVATMNPETRQLTYSDVSTVWGYDFNGELETINSRGTPAFAVTPNHTIWASTKRVSKLRAYSADRLPQAAKIPQTAKWEDGIAPDFIRFKSPGANGKALCFSSLDWCEFLGWFIAEGSLDPAPRYAIRISQTNYKGRMYITELLTRMGVNFHYQPREINFNNRALFEYLSALGKSHSKHIPREVLFYPKELLNRLLWSLVEADGTWISKKTGHFVTASKRLVDDVMELAVKCGFRPTVSLQFDKPGTNPYGDNHNPRYHVHLLKKHNDTLCGQHRKKMPYEGKVYCVTVPPHHTVLTRYNGRVSWSGQSAEFAFAAIDELTKNDYNVFTYIRTRLRWPTLPDIECQLVGGSNPGGIGHAWVKQLFIDRIYGDEWVTNDADYRAQFSFIKSLADDNPHLDPAYWAMLNTLPPSLRQAFRMGNWDIFVGQAFTFYRTSHVYQCQNPPEYAPLYHTFDWGYGKPFSNGWWWVDGDGRVHRFREWYGWNGTPDEGLRITDVEIAKQIVEKEKEWKIWGRKILRLAGPDCFSKKPDYKGGGQGPSTAEEFAKEGIFISKGDPDRKLKIRQFHERLRVPTDGTLPMLVVDPSCEAFIRTIPSIPVDKNDLEDCDTKSEDHVYDEACHVLMARPLKLKEPEARRSAHDRRIERLEKKQIDPYVAYAEREAREAMNDLGAGGVDWGDVGEYDDSSKQDLRRTM